MHRWAACILSRDVSVVAELRLIPGIEVAEICGTLWLRGQNCDAALEKLLQKIPGLELFDLLDSGRLKRRGFRIPDRMLPPATWQWIGDFVKTCLPAAALAGEVRQKLSIRLIRSQVVEPASALLTTARSWTEIATTAPLARLAPLRFAAAEHGQVLVLGLPLPSVTGCQLVDRQGILVPCGFTWEPGVDASVLRQLFGLGADGIAILSEDNTHQVLCAEQFVKASRSAARGTWEGLANV